MKKIDLYRLRHAMGLSQKELAEKLGVRPSFLSAIEKGRSRFPDDKLDLLKQVCGVDDLTEYTVEVESEGAVPPHTHPHTHDGVDSQLLGELMEHLHEHEHSRADVIPLSFYSAALERIAALEARNDRLAERNDRLAERIDQLREEIDKLRTGNR